MSEELKKYLHDLRSPLAVLQGFLHFTEKKDLGDEGREYWKAAVASLEKIRRIIDDLGPRNSP